MDCLEGLRVTKRRNEGEWNGGWMGWRVGKRFRSSIGKTLTSMFDKIVNVCLRGMGVWSWAYVG